MACSCVVLMQTGAAASFKTGFRAAYKQCPKHTSCRGGAATAGSLKANAHPFSRCLTCAGSRAEGWRRNPGIASRLTLLTVGKASLRVCCLLPGACAGSKSDLASALACSTDLPGVCTDCALGKPEVRLLRAVVMVRPRCLLGLLPGGRMTVTGHNTLSSQACKNVRHSVVFAWHSLTWKADGWFIR